MFSVNYFNMYAMHGSGSGTLCVYTYTFKLLLHCSIDGPSENKVISTMLVTEYY